MAIQVRMRYAAIVLGLLLSFAANAQWTVINLHPAGTGSSGARVSGGQQVGTVGGLQFGPHASLWTGTADSWVDLTPTHIQGTTLSYGLGVGDDQQVGFTAVSGVQRASLWTGSADSWEDLHPEGALSSHAYAAGGGQQVGFVEVGGVFRACLWAGTAGSLVYLTPPGTFSFAYDTDGVQQVGVYGNASLWTGTAGSYVDLHPAGSFYSEALGVGDSQQVGFAWFGVYPNHISHASLWSGTAASWVDLHPSGATWSLSNDVSAGQQVGSATVGGVDHASLWSGTAGSWVDLHAFLPAGFTSSTANGISHDGGLTHVVGKGFNSATNRTEALMWVSRAVAPTSYSMFRGTVFSGNLNSLLSSDGNKLVLRPGVVLTSGEPPVQIRINSTAPSANPNGISFSVESSASFPFAQQKVSLWNYDTGAYELLDTRVVTTSDDTVTVTVRTNAHRFIDNGTLALRALVSYKAVGPSILYPWSARIDKAWWTFPG